MKQPQDNQQPIDPRMMQATYADRYDEDEIDLLEYWQVIWKKRWLIIGVSLCAAVLAVGFALSKPNIYKAEVLLSPVGDGKSTGGLSSMLGGLGGLASMAGVSLGGGGGTVEQHLAVLKSRAFIWRFVTDEKLMPVLFEGAWDGEAQRWIAENKEAQPTLWDAWRLLTAVLSVSTDKKSGLVTMGIEWHDPELATVWVMKLVDRLNAHLREQAIRQSMDKMHYLEQELLRVQVEENRKILFDLISVEQKQSMLANTQQEFAFKVIDAAAVPDRKIKPKRAIIVILTTFLAGFLCVIVVFIQEGLRKRKKDETENI